MDEQKCASLFVLCARLYSEQCYQYLTIHIERPSDNMTDKQLIGENME
jgi:hypothetical protein